MQQNGLGATQVVQVRGYADQKLRKPDQPLDPCNRRISVIVQYIVKDEDSGKEEAHPEGEGKPSPAVETKKE
jgi:chemotaxis protein MotB